MKVRDILGVINPDQNKEVPMVFDNSPVNNDTPVTEERSTTQPNDTRQNEPTLPELNSVEHLQETTYNPSQPSTVTNEITVVRLELNNETNPLPDQTVSLPEQVQPVMEVSNGTTGLCIPTTSVTSNEVYTNDISVSTRESEEPPLPSNQQSTDQKPIIVTMEVQETLTESQPINPLQLHELTEQKQPEPPLSPPPQPKEEVNTTVSKDTTSSEPSKDTKVAYIIQSSTENPKQEHQMPSRGSGSWLRITEPSRKARDPLRETEIALKAVSRMCI